MKIVFDYNEVEPQNIANVIQQLYDKYAEFKIKNNGEEIGHVEFGKINLYITLRNSNDNSPISFVSKGKEIEWTVKNTPMKKTRKSLVLENKESNIYVYEN